MPKTELHWLMSQFHQDWYVQFPDWPELVDHWVAGSTVAQINEAVGEIDALLAIVHSEERLEEALSGLQCEYSADDEGGFRGWPVAVRGRLATSLSSEST